jgi:hypothetical protein
MIYLEKAVLGPVTELLCFTVLRRASAPSPGTGE